MKNCLAGVKRRNDGKFFSVRVVMDADVIECKEAKDEFDRLTSAIYELNLKHLVRMEVISPEEIQRKYRKKV